LNFIGLEQRPLSIALVTDQPTELVVKSLNPFSTYAPLQKALSSELRRPVAIDVCLPFQASSGLENGWYDLAVITPAQYAGFDTLSAGRVLAVPEDRQHHAARCAQLVVSAGSGIRRTSQLRGRSVAFGPAGDSLTHYAALRLLIEAGIKKTDLALDLLPVPGSLKHCPDMRAVAQAVIAGSAQAGFIDEAAWEELPAHAAGETEPARDKLRVIARTTALPDVLVVAGRRLDPHAADRVQAFLLAAATRHQEVLEPLSVSGYTAPSEDVLKACRSLAPVVKASAPPTSQAVERS
jgi:ABC-type phosphate/phosphonate transport system substrate-binding protein